MLLYTMTVIAAVVSTAIAFDKDRNAPAWYCFALALPLVMYMKTGWYLASVAASMLPVLVLALLPAVTSAREAATIPLKTATATH